MSSLSDRIASVGQVNPDLTVVGRYNTPTETPLVRIQVFPGVIAYDELQPLIAADGAPIAATATNNWSQLYAAGRP